MRVLVVDNYDSFVFNLVQYLGQLGVDAEVWRNDDDRLAGDAEIAAAAGDGSAFGATITYIDQPSPDSTLQKTYDKRGHDLLQDYIDHAHSVHKALIENWGITVSPDPGSKPLPVGEDAPRWYGVGKAPDYSKPGHPPTPSQDPVPTSGYTPVHTFKHILRTDANRNLGHQFTGVPKPYVGGWRTTEFKGREGEDLVVEDQSTVHQDKDEALKQAKIRNEQAVFEADTFKDIPNPHYKP